MECDNCNGTGVLSYDDDIGDSSMCTCTACEECNGTGERN